MAGAFWEFFAGGGMARAGLGPGWRCLLANDIDPKKAASYRANWGDAALRIGDVAALRDLPGRPDLVWASFPCQDLSLAGPGGGLDGARSGALWPCLGHVRRLVSEGRAPALLAFENVTGLVSARGGADFAALLGALSALGYRSGALVIDAALFTPQSRPRLFVVALRRDVAPPEGAAAPGPTAWQPPALAAQVARLDERRRSDWLWWAPPPPPARNAALADIVEPDPADAPWFDAAATARLVALMGPVHRGKLAAAEADGAARVGALYRRTRRENGVRTQRAEVRFDGLAGCLRTPGGGSSRQFLLFTEGGERRARLLSAREAARLMGLAEDYRLPARHADALHLTGDGVVIPAVRWLARHVLEPALAAARARRAA